MSAAMPGQDFAALVQRIMRNFRFALSSSVVVGLLGLAALAVNARALSVAELGSLVTVQAYAVMIGGLISFSTHLPVMRMGAAASEHGHIATLYGLVRLALAVDLVAGAVAAGTALVIAWPLADAIGLSAAVRSGLIYFSAALLFTSLSSGTGLLRLVNRFETLSALDVGAAIVTLGGAVTLAWSDSGLEAYFILYALVQGVLPLARYILARGALRRAYPMAAGGGEPLRRAAIREFIVFAGTSSVTSSIDTLRNSADTVVASHFFPTEVVGIYGVAKQLAGAVRKFAGFASLVSFAEIGRLEARGDVRQSRALFVRLLAISGAVGAAAVAAAVLLGGWILATGFGPAYVAAYASLVILSVGAALHFIANPIIMYVQIVRGAVPSLIAGLLALLAFGGWIAMVGPGSGVEGIALANVAFFLVLIAAGLMLLRRSRMAQT